MSWNNIYKTQGKVQTKSLSIIKLFEDLLINKKNVRILDLGCGTGRHTFYLAKNSNFNLYSLDVSSEGLKLMANKIKKIKLSNIRLIKGNFSDIQFQNNYFDAIISTKALHHGSYKEIENFVFEITRVLKPSGLLMLVTLSEKDFRLKTGKMYKGDKNTKIGCQNLPDSNLPHHFFNDKELSILFKEYTFIEKKITKRIAMTGLKPSTYYDLILRKK